MAEAAAPKRRPLVGIIGGMGPEATVDLMRRIILATPARDDADHIHVLADNNPAVPSRIKALIEKTGPSPLPELVRMAKGLASSGATMLAMPCNTAHYYAGDIAAAVTIPFLDMIVLTADRVVKMVPPKATIGMLASTAVIDIGLYERALHRHGLEIKTPDRQDDVMAIIRAVKAGDTGTAQREDLSDIADELMQAGADIVLVACTELSILTDSITKTVPVVDALTVLAEEIVARARE
jgi:aspartate racemase